MTILLLAWAMIEALDAADATTARPSRAAVA